eukprot:TRINITY_DN21550_c0_g3_i1.p1 TRINITY_DN21550_c0_g3~~TRINITY_DN21550_c0_g3_i1.p1  ORF type:complete len:422 (+),score=37.73 TRINITY_DN21550_c0_g3_i1:94-1359(+)
MAPPRVAPSQALPFGSLPLTDEHIRSWREEGFLLLDRLIEPSLIERARSSAYSTLAPGNHAEVRRGFGQLQFPYESSESVLNDVTLHPRIIASAKQLLGCADVRLTQSDTWLKVGRPKPDAGHWNRMDNDDQRVHVDFPNHTLVVPPPWHSPEAVAMILYLDDEDSCGGATRLVPRRGPNDEAYAYPSFCSTPGMGIVPYINDRTTAEHYLRERLPDVAAFRSQLYQREVEVGYRTGSLLLYRHDTWHRGTPLREGAQRVAMQLLFKRPGTDWFGHWNPGWSRFMYRPERHDASKDNASPDDAWKKPSVTAGLERTVDIFGGFEVAPLPRWVASLTVEQRSCLGFPPPGHPYWTRETLEAVRQRYEPLGMDMREYHSALSESQGESPASEIEQILRRDGVQIETIEKVLEALQKSQLQSKY